MHFDDGRVVSNLICQALSGRDITIYGDGSQTRSFCYVADTVEGIIRLMECDLDRLEPVNLGNPVERSEEHTSELQSLMRISYAVFCLKKTQQIDNYFPY